MKLAALQSIRRHVAGPMRSCSARFSSSAPDERVNFLAEKPKDIIAKLRELGYPSYRLKQIHRYVYERDIFDPSRMVDIPVDLRKKLDQVYTFGRMTIAEELVSQDGTVKRAYRLHDGQLIESVLMPYADGRFTACISSQVGCAMKCSFCATGQMGFARQLSHAEIFEQALRFSTGLRAQNKRLSNVVFMGMGEPLKNYTHVVKAIRRIQSSLGMGGRRITVSTVGVAPRIRMLADEDLQCGLAVSLHQANDSARSALMPVNDKHPIKEVLEACEYYISKTNRRVSFEWALINGVTDTREAAMELGSLLKGMLCHVNLIPLNPTLKFDGGPSNKEAADEFRRTLSTYGVTATMRVRRGLDINAGCGQLTSKLKLQAEQEADLASTEGSAESMEMGCIGSSGGLTCVDGEEISSER